MKKFLLVFAASLCLFTARGQKPNGLSLETTAGYFYHFMGGNTHNNFNYGFSLLLSQRLQKVKISAGVDYTTKFYYYETTPTATYFLSKREYRMQYLDFPMLVTIRVSRHDSPGIGILAGLVVNKVIGYEIVSYYSNQLPVDEDHLDIPKGCGLTLRLGMVFSKQLSKRLVLHVTPFWDTKMILNGTDDNIDPHAGSYKSLPDNRFTAGLMAGIEYLF